MAAPVRRVRDVKNVDETAARVANRRDNPLQRAFTAVLDDDARCRSEISAEVGIDTTWIGNGGGDAVFNEAPRERAAFDEKLDFEGACQHPMQGADDQLVLTDGQRTHNLRLYDRCRPHVSSLNAAYAVRRAWMDAALR